MGANLEKSLFAPRAYAVPLCPKGEIVFVYSLRSLWSCYAPRAFAVFVCSATSKSLHTSRATLYSLYMVCVPMQSLYNQKRKSLAYLLPPLQSPFAPQPIKSLPCHTTLCSLYSSRKPLQSSYEQKQKSLRLLFCACSLHSYKIPLQSPYIAPTLKVPPHHARLSVSICSVYLCGLGVTFAPLRSLLASGRYRALYYIFLAPQVDVPINGRYIAGTSAGATGGILKFTLAECRRNHRR